MHPIQIEIVEAQQSEEKMEALIKKYEAFILSAAAQISRRHITKSDDEWSIAFYDAVNSTSDSRYEALETFACKKNRRKY